MIISIIVSILALVGLVSGLKLNPFLAFLLVCIGLGVALGMPPVAIATHIKKGIGDMLGELFIIIGLGAILGKLVAESGAAQQVSTHLIGLFGTEKLPWAMMATGFIIGIPLFYNVGFVLLVPLIYSVAQQSARPILWVGMPMIAALSVTHGFLPPHPSPAALVSMFKADLGQTMLYGCIIALPTLIMAGPIFSRFLTKIQGAETGVQIINTIANKPSIAFSYLMALLPVLLLVGGSIGKKYGLGAGFEFLVEPVFSLLLSVLIIMGIVLKNSALTWVKITEFSLEAFKEVSMVFLVIAGAGALKQILVAGGASQSLAEGFQNLPLPPLVLAWLLAAIIRLCLGSATVAGLTAGGLLATTLPIGSYTPSLMVLSIGAGSLFFSHINDGGFWLFKEYFKLSVKDTLLSWSIMETIVSVCGLVGVLILNYWLGL